jgi:hypothetical protein
MGTNVDRREHKILSDRRQQLSTNILAWKGGRPYIDRRLWRAPNESDLSWCGTNANGVRHTSLDTFASAGRRQRAALVNDAGRVVSKITQYLFKVAAERAGIDDEWAKDVTGDGVSAANFWVEVSENLTAGQWVWLQADRLPPAVDPQTGLQRTRTLFEKQRDGDHVRWSVWPSVSVPDWSFSPDGKLRWIITEGSLYDNSDPREDAKDFRIRTLWEMVDRRCQTTQYLVNRSTGESESYGKPSTFSGIDRIPFILVGTPAAETWWFDDVEGIQAQLLNLDSLHYENLVRTVFPQLVIPASTLENLEMKLVERMGAANGEKIVEVVREIVRGLDTPIVESAEDSGITRFIQPSKSDQETIPNELQRKRALLFDMVGLSLFNKETRQIQTAESKQFDQLDTESTLKHRALVLQAAEERLVELSVAIDPSFGAYSPVWPTSFDVVDVAADSAAVAMLSNMPGITPAMQQIALRGALRILAERGGYDEKLIAQAREEIGRISSDDGDGGPAADAAGSIQQLALARQRALDAGDTATAAKIDSKIDDLISRV